MNKSSPTAWIVLFKANLPKDIHCHYTSYYCKCLTRKSWTLKTKDNVMEHSIRNFVIRLQISNPIKDITDFALPFTIKEILAIFIRYLEILDQDHVVQHSPWSTFDLENVGQDHRIEYSQWRHPVVNTNRYKAPTYFYSRSHRFRDINVSTVWSSNIKSRSPSTTFVMMPYSCEYQPLSKS